MIVVFVSFGLGTLGVHRPPVLCLHKFFHSILFLSPNSKPTWKAGDAAVVQASNDAMIPSGGAWEGLGQVLAGEEKEDMKKWGIFFIFHVAPFLSHPGGEENVTQWIGFL